MLQTTNTQVIDFLWYKLRQTEGGVVDNHLLPYVTWQLPEDTIEIALEDCFPDTLPQEIDEEKLYEHFFIPWLLFNWIPYDDFYLDGFDPEQSIAFNYLKTYAGKLNSSEKKFIEAMIQTYYSFYSILEIEPEGFLLVKDILLDTTHKIKERCGTHDLKLGDIVFGRILTLDGQSVFVGMAPYTIPASYQSDLVDLRNEVIEECDDKQLTIEMLRDEFDLALLDYFFEVMGAVYNTKK